MSVLRPTTSGVQRFRFSAAQEAEIARLYRDEDMSLVELAERFGAHRWTISRTLRRLGVPRRPRGYAPHSRARYAAEARP